MMDGQTATEQLVGALPRSAEGRKARAGAVRIGRKATTVAAIRDSCQALPLMEECVVQESYGDLLTYIWPMYKKTSW